jgi:uncharacterized protein (TIGR02217 family)
MTVEIYPATPIPYRTLVTSQAFKTVVSEYDYGNEQRFPLRRFSKRNFDLQYRISYADRNTVHSFFRARGGKYDPFWFVDFSQREWTDEYVGRGDGATQTFDLHSLRTVSASTTIYVNGTSAPFTFASGGGQASSDRVTITTAPPSGALITSKFTGNLRIKGRFDDDALQEDLSNFRLVFLALRIVEIQW